MKDEATPSQQYLAEAVGTFILVFVGCGAVIVNQLSFGTLGQFGIAAAFGATLAVMIVAFAPVSGGHFNPAVTIAFAAAGRFPSARVLSYVLAQCVGALAASIAHVFVFGPVWLYLRGASNLDIGITAPANHLFMTAFAIEFIVSALLMLAVVSVSQGYRALGRAAAPAIGAAFFLAVLLAGPISGGSANPARSLGPQVVSWLWQQIYLFAAAQPGRQPNGPMLTAGQWTSFIAYLIGPILGAACGAMLYQKIRPNQEEELT